MLKIISSFHEVELTKDEKYLILCDIDETILHFPDCDRKCKEIINVLAISDKEYQHDFNLLRILYRNTNPPTHTDYDGFVSMLQKINETNSKLFFLTARGIESDNLTRSHLQQIGISLNDFEIHYTAAQITKGEYIKKYIDLSEWKNVIFIDDCISNIQSVLDLELDLDLHPQIVCYKFEIPK